ncbi:hypothetical protein ABL78_7240 [Leptomonas seymouri]|uniref:ribonuclease Z n=1 Tax=Leptomonas seymouri TaxID=5684 RepID=A0A0N1PCD8_LEPSE|nr:hypothetical protein ABL78_7240 [Leptomonas seymouri]|eukprot:KPI83720.1 hypothetical protein ABL78_7240 [Leptomonas seymouri]
MMSYIQLLGSDTPNGYGGCCYYGPLEHPALQEVATTAAPLTAPAPQKVDGNASLCITAVPAVGALEEARASVLPRAPGTKGSSTVNSIDAAPDATAAGASSSKRAENGQVDNDTATRTTQPARSWSYLHSPRPTWPDSGPLHLASLLHPKLPPGASSATAPHVTADAGSCGNDGYIFFNCPEGTQRFSSEANIKLRKVRCFCFTRWNCTRRSDAATSESESSDASLRSAEGGAAVGAASAAMGLPGMLFTINDAGSRQAAFFGPSAGLDRLCGSKCTAALSVAASAQPADAPGPSEGLRGFLTALRHHYFQRRPMLFRQLHGVRRVCVNAALLSDGAVSADEAKTKAATVGNEVHFVEIAGGAGDTVECAVASAEPFVYATIPLSAQSLLVAFRISGSCPQRERAASTGGGGTATTSIPAASGGLLHNTGALDNAGEGASEGVEQTADVSTAPSLFALCKGAVVEGRDNSANAASRSHHSEVAFSPPDSSNVVLGYAIVVAPGATFDAAKARALGVRSGPKYGQLKQGLSVEVDAVNSIAGSSSSKKKRVPQAKTATTAGLNVDTGATATPELATTSSSHAAVEEAPSGATHTTRWIHPYQVMRPTAATKHAYISLVLDGDAPQDVRRALGRLLGGQQRGERCGSDRDAEGGALMRLLREEFPHLMFYCDAGEEAAVEGEEGRQADNGSVPMGPDGACDHPSASFKQHPRQLTVRHVTHVQPASYFENFRSRGNPSTGMNAQLQQQQHRTSDRGAFESDTEDCASDMQKGDVYAAYNSYIFADVVATTLRGPHNSRMRDCDTVQVSLDPSLSFTLSDLAEDEEDALTVAAAAAAAATSAENPANSQVRSQSVSPRTWHFFTSYVQHHFTAFPTALVHRYHLHHLAPMMFPLHGCGESSLNDSAVVHSSRAALPALPGSDHGISEVIPTTEYWPYSLKLRCVPEIAQQLRRTDHISERGVPTPATGAVTAHPSRQTAFKKNSAHEMRLVEAEAATGAAPAPPWKREKKEVSEETRATPESKAVSALPHQRAHGKCPPNALSCTPLTKAAADQSSKEATPSTHRLAVVDGLTSLLPYPTPASAMALLSESFLTSLQPPSLKPPADGATAVAASCPLEKGGRPPSGDGHDGAMRGGEGELGFLGTGSAVPSKYRNVSGTYLALFLPRYCFGEAPMATKRASDSGGAKAGFAVLDDCALPDNVSPSAELRRGVVILDFGEGSAGQLASLCEGVRAGVCGQQMRRHHCTSSSCARKACTEVSEADEGRQTRTSGMESAAAPSRTPYTTKSFVCDVEWGGNRDGRLRQFVLDIILVFISHAHADHHLGLLSLLTLRHHYLSEQRPAPSSSSSKLLVVCPTEVYCFLMDAWGSTAPYGSWLHEECEFELMPPPLRHTSSDATTAARTEATEEGEGRDHADLKSALDADRRRVTPDKYEDHSTDAASSSFRCHHELHATNAASQQHVVPMPLLQAQLSRWNSCISQYLKASQEQRLDDDETSAPSERAQGRRGDGGASALTDAAALSSEVWWDAEVITVDHPANAHALLLRFPHFFPRASTRPAETHAHAVLPGDSRVFLFSGDTRPSDFLVERSRAFTASSSPTTAPVFILLHEATFGPGFEGEAIRKKHSTLPEALEIGAAVEATFVVLNHFSQRYPKLPGLSEEQLDGRPVNLVCQRRSRATTVIAPAVSSSTEFAELKDLKALADEGSVKEADGRSGDGLDLSSPAVTAEHEEVDGEPQQQQQQQQAAMVEASAASPPSTSPYANVSFAFDLMLVSFMSMHRGLVFRLTPLLVRLLEEYDSWGVSTTQRMRTSRIGDDSNSASSSSGGGGGGGGGQRAKKAEKPQRCLRD